MKKENKHYLKTKSSFILVVLRSLRHKGCVCCGQKTETLEEAGEHWKKELNVK